MCLELKQFNWSLRDVFQVTSHRQQGQEGSGWDGCIVFSQQTGCTGHCHPQHAQRGMAGAPGSALAVEERAGVLESYTTASAVFPTLALRKSIWVLEAPVYFTASGNQHLELLPFITLTVLELLSLSSAWQLQAVLNKGLNSHKEFISQGSPTHYSTNWSRHGAYVIW